MENSTTLSSLPSSSRTVYSDRFIPSRKGSNFALFDLPTNSSSSPGGGSVRNKPFGRAYNGLLRTVLFGPDNSNIFKFKNEMPRARRSLLPPMSEDDLLPPLVQRQSKKVSLSFDRQLVARDLRDDYYCNLLDWSDQNVLATGPGPRVHLLNDDTGKATKLLDLGADDMVSSVCWAQRGTLLAVGTDAGELQIWDVSSQRRIRTMEGHTLKLGALAWSSSLLASGSMDLTILQRDIRARDNFVSKLTGHNWGISGLKWSHDGTQLASATGGADCNVLVWNRHSTQPVLTRWEHTAPVRALAWSPHDYGLLASGGPRSSIRIWNTTTDSHLNCVHTEGQVCNLFWSKYVNQLVSSHGGLTNNVTIWQYPNMRNLASETSHFERRALYMAVSPNEDRVATGAGDESVSLWNVLPCHKSHDKQSKFESSPAFGRTYIR